MRIINIRSRKPYLWQTISFDPILEALNNGITLPHLQESLKEIGSEEWGCDFEEIEDEDGNITRIWEPCKFGDQLLIRDLTGDGVNEIILAGTWGGAFMYHILQIYTCQNGKYSKLFFHRYHYHDSLDILDLNRNNIPEIIIHNYYDPMHGPHLLYIYEWDGNDFRNLIPQEYWNDYNFPGAFATEPHARVENYNLNNNGTYDVLIRGIPGDFGEVSFTGPYRVFSITVTWNGTHFIPGYEQLDPPTYRFQAVQDGDWETLHGSYERALAFYNQALNDPYLKGWSEKIYRQQYDALGRSGLPTLTPSPPDPDEKETLTAYIHYRKILIYTAQGKHEEALEEYLALTKLSPNEPGYAYKGLAAVFWKKYQNTQDLATACIKTQMFAHENYDEIFNPIDRAWHGWDSPAYNWNKMLICPFGETEDEKPEPWPTQTATQEYWPSN